MRCSRPMINMTAKQNQAEHRQRTRVSQGEEGDGHTLAARTAGTANPGGAAAMDATGMGGTSQQAWAAGCSRQTHKVPWGARSAAVGSSSMVCAIQHMQALPCNPPALQLPHLCVYCSMVCAIQHTHTLPCNIFQRCDLPTYACTAQWCAPCHS